MGQILRKRIPVARGRLSEPAPARRLQHKARARRYPVHALVGDAGAVADLDAPRRTGPAALPARRAGGQPFEGGGLNYETSHFCDLVRSGALESPVMTHAKSLQMITMMDAARAALGLKFNGE